MGSLHKKRNVKAKWRPCIVYLICEILWHISMAVKVAGWVLFWFIFNRYKLKIIYICEYSLVLIHWVFLLITV
jgi:hypothetical protein